ncbi:MAG: hypothetical protein IJK51_07760 [Bacteroidaceae bacterium]|jgi:hypothetical protein|nr:hypothetical protein [Bacteroidaceae bacterium]
MKKTAIIIAGLLLAAGVQTTWAQKVVITKSDDTKIELDLSEVKEMMFEEEAEPHEWVDLGLPSGTLWATCNIGADSPEEKGDYFAWGETETKTGNNWANYVLCNKAENTLTRYCAQSEWGNEGYTDNLTELLPEDDAATAIWGAKWQMPSLEQVQELTTCSSIATSLNGVPGRKIFSRLDPQNVWIFLPYTGWRQARNYNDMSYGYYWGRTLYSGNSNYATGIYVNNSYVGTDNGINNPNKRCYGRPIRPVRVK